jgi:hypothetical protein
MYFPKVTHQYASNNIPQMRSDTQQTPFFFGGSQVPVALGMSGSGFHYGSHSKTHSGLDFVTRKGDKVYHRNHHYIKETNAPYKGKGIKGSKSKTHLGDLNYTTKKSSTVYHQGGHDIHKSVLPFSHY